MGAIIGIVIVLVMVFGGYLAAGGKMSIILHSLPYEMSMIGGAAVGAFVVSNDMTTIKHALGDVKAVFAGGKWKPKDYTDLLCLMFELIRVARQSPVAIEQHIEQPGESAIFGRYPRIAADKTAVNMICDTIRSATMNFDDPHQVEDLLEKQLEAQKHDAMHGPHALQNMADGLPALGIVAAVLGVIKTMASIDKPPEVLGQMIGGALVGTFLGVFLAYGLVGPFAAKAKSIQEEDARFYALIKDTLIANLQKHPPTICVEVARQNVPYKMRPSFSETEEALRALPVEAA